MAYRTGSATSVSGTGTSAAVPCAVGGDVFDIVEVDLYSETADATITPPAGFTLKTEVSQSQGATRGRLTTWWKRLTAADTGTYTFSWTTSCIYVGAARAYTGRIKLGDPYEPSAVSQSDASGSAFTSVFTSPTIRYAGSDIIGACGHRGSNTSWTPPSGFTERLDVSHLTAVDVEASAVGSLGSKTFTAVGGAGGYMRTWVAGLMPEGRVYVSATMAMATFSGATPGAVSATPTGYRVGDRLFVVMKWKPSSVTLTSVTNGWTISKTGVVGTGASGTTDVGQLGYAVLEKIATSTSESMPAPTFSAAVNTGIFTTGWAACADGYIWADPVATSATYIEAISDTNTAAPLGGTASAFAAQPTTGDAIMAVGSGPSDDLGNLGSFTMSATGLSDGYVPAVATVQRLASTLANDMVQYWSHWTGFTGTASSGVAVSITGSAGDHSGGVVLIALRQTIGTTVTGGLATEADSALTGTTTRGSLITGGLATETDSALTGTIKRGYNLTGGLATETDTALPGVTSTPLVIEDPRDIPGLLLWVSAEGEYVYSDGDPMTTWHDLGAGGNDLPAQGVNPPVWHATGGPDGGPWVEFPGTVVGDDDAGYFDLPTSIWSGLTEVSILYSLVVDDTSQESGWTRATDSPNDQNAFYTYSDGNVYDHFASTTRKSGTHGGGSGVDPETWHRYLTMSGPGDWRSYVNDFLGASDGTNTVSLPSVQAESTLGSEQGTVERLAFLGGMAAVIVYDHVLTDEEREALDTWLTDNPSGGETGQVVFGGLATEADSALAGTTTGYGLITGGLAVETDTALTGSILFGTAIFGGLAVETDTALSGIATANVIISGGLATETDTALEGRLGDFVDGGIATETDTALAGTVSGGVVFVDTDITNRVGGRQRQGLGIAYWEPPVVIPPVDLGGPLVDPDTGDPVTDVDGDYVYPPLLVNRTLPIAVSFTALPTVAPNGNRPLYTALHTPGLETRTRIIVNGKDVTYFRGVATPNPSYEYIVPLLYGPGTLIFPQVMSYFEVPGEGALSWLKKFARVVVQRVRRDNGQVYKTDWKGFIIGFDTAGRDLVCQLGGEASGLAAMRDQQQPVFEDYADIGHYAYRAIRDLGLPFVPNGGPTTGIEIDKFGGTGMLDYISQITARGWTRAGNQWTIMPSETDNKYRMARKNTSVIHGTVYVDDARTVASLARDFSEEPNRIFMEGVTPEGRRYRWAVYPGLVPTKAAPYPFNDNRDFGLGTTNEDTDTGDGITLLKGRLQGFGYLKRNDAAGAEGTYDADIAEGVVLLQEDIEQPQTGEMNVAAWRALYDLDSTGYSLEWSHIEPASQQLQVKDWIRSASGSIMRANPDYDPSIPKVDRTVNIGAGFWKKQAKKWATAERHAAQTENWVGSISFNTGALVAGDHSYGDPVTAMLAKDLRPGMNLSLPTFMGGIVVHVSGVSVPTDGAVTATVDTRARDTMPVWEVIASRRETRGDPARAYAKALTESAQNKDAVEPWDSEGGTLYDAVEIPAHTWVIAVVVGGQEGAVRSLRVKTSPVAEFCMAVFGRPISTEKLDNLIGNPLASKSNWTKESVRETLEKDNWLLYAAGTPEEPCGYSPGVKTEHDPLTGKHHEESGFSYYAHRGGLYVAFYADRATKIPAGRIMLNQLDGGS